MLLSYVPCVVILLMFCFFVIFWVHITVFDSVSLFRFLVLLLSFRFVLLMFLLFGNRCSLFLPWRALTLESDCLSRAEHCDDLCRGCGNANYTQGSERQSDEIKKWE